MVIKLVMKESDASLASVESKGNIGQMLTNFGNEKFYLNQKRYDALDHTDLFFTSYLVKVAWILILECLSVVQNLLVLTLQYNRNVIQGAWVAQSVKCLCLRLRSMIPGFWD